MTPPLRTKPVPLRLTCTGLTDLPNIGPETARWLAAAGLCTPRALKRAGAVAAALRIRRLRPEDPPCRSLLAGLQGAIQGVRWHDLPKAQREAVWQEYAARAAGESISPRRGRGGLYRRRRGGRT